MLREHTTCGQTLSTTGGPKLQTVVFSTSLLRVGLYDTVASESDSLLGISVSASFVVRAFQTNALGVGLSFRGERMMAWPPADGRVR